MNNLKSTYSSDPRKDQETLELKESLRKINDELTTLKRKKVEAPLQQFMEMERPSDAYRPAQEVRRLEEELRAVREHCR